MIGVSRLGTACSIRDSSQPRGMWTAPGMCPSSHSSRSRTSRKTGASASSRTSRARPTSISSICSLVSWRKSRYELIAFQKIASRRWLWSNYGPTDPHVPPRRARSRRGGRTPRCDGRLHAHEHRRACRGLDAGDPERARAGACARARPRRPDRSGGGGAPTRKPALRSRETGGGRADVRALQLSAGPGRRRGGGVAERDGDAARAARRPPPDERGGAAPPRPRRDRLRARPGRTGRLAAGARAGSEHSAGVAGREPALPALRARPAAVRSELLCAGLDLPGFRAAPARRVRPGRRRRRPSEADVWLRAAAARAALLGRARVRGGRESGSGRRRGTDRCGSRPLLEGQTGRCFLTARPLGTALSAFSDRPVPSGRAPGLDRRARQGSPGVSARPCGGPAHAAGQDRERVPRATKSQVTAAQGPGAQGPGAQGPFPFSQSQKAFACDADQKGRGGSAAAAANPERRRSRVWNRTYKPQLGPNGLWRLSETRARVPELREPRWPPDKTSYGELGIFSGEGEP